MEEVKSKIVNQFKILVHSEKDSTKYLRETKTVKYNSMLVIWNKNTCEKQRQLSTTAC